MSSMDSWKSLAEYEVPHTVKVYASFFCPGDLWTGDLHVPQPCCKVFSAMLMPASTHVSLTGALCLHVPDQACFVTTPHTA